MKPKQFTKADLKDGMVVLLRGSNDRHLVINNRFVAEKDGWMGFDSYSDELLEKCFKDKDFDVMEVFEVIRANSLSIKDWQLKSIWKREEKLPAQIEIEQIQNQIDELNARLETLKGSV